MHLSTIQRAPCVPQTQMPSARRSHYTRLKDVKVTTSNLALYRQRACSSASSAKTSRGPLSLTRKSRRIRVIHSVTARLLFSSAPRVRAFLLSSLFKYKSIFFLSLPGRTGKKRYCLEQNANPTSVDEALTHDGARRNNILFTFAFVQKRKKVTSLPPCPPPLPTLRRARHAGRNPATLGRKVKPGLDYCECF